MLSPLAALPTPLKPLRSVHARMSGVERLHRAAASNDADGIVVLVEARNIPVDANQHGITALHVAAHSSCAEAVAVLLRLGAAVASCVDMSCCSHTAAVSCLWGCCTSLLRADAPEALGTPLWCGPLRLELAASVRTAQWPGHVRAVPWHHRSQAWTGWASPLCTMQPTRPTRPPPPRSSAAGRPSGPGTPRAGRRCTTRPSTAMPRWCACCPVAVGQWDQPTWRQLARTARGSG